MIPKVYFYIPALRFDHGHSSPCLNLRETIHIFFSRMQPKVATRVGWISVHNMCSFYLLKQPQNNCDAYKNIFRKKYSCKAMQFAMEY